MEKQIQISTDKTKLDIRFVHEYLSRESYWARGRPEQLVEKTIRNSLCFGVYLPDGRQVAFARVVTDKAIFAWLMDVFVAPEFRRKGIGSALIRNILAHEDVKDVDGIGLRTEDAHALYRPFGFSEIPKTHTWMLRKRNHKA